MTEPAVRISNLTKIFPIPLRNRRLIAVRDLSLEVQPGEVYGLLGPNGSGKSTTLKALLGLIEPTSGRTEIFGRDSARVSCRTLVGFLPESPYFYRYLSGAEGLRFYGRLAGLRGAALRENAGRLLSLVGLEDAAHRRIGSYSKGMLQRFGLAQALIGCPRLVILDEPTAGVDPAGSRQIRDIILQLKKDGITVLLSSHLLAQVQEICDRIGILNRGRLVREGCLEDLVSVENQTEVLIENPTPDLLKSIEEAIARSPARLVAMRKRQTTLERFFLETTAQHPVAFEQSADRAEGERLP